MAGLDEGWRREWDAAVWVVWNNYAYASIRGLQRGDLGGRELATDFRHPETGEPYNPDFAALALLRGGGRQDRPGQRILATRSRPRSPAANPI